MMSMASPKVVVFFRIDDDNSSRDSSSITIQKINIYLLVMSNKVKVMATTMPPKIARVSRATLGYTGRRGGKALNQRMYHPSTLNIQPNDGVYFHHHARGVVCMAEPDEEQLRAANAEYAQLSDAIEVCDIITIMFTLVCGFDGH